MHHLSACFSLILVRDGVVLTPARRRKERRNPELCHPAAERVQWFWRWSWRQVVIRDEVCTFGQGMVSSRGTTPPEKRRTGLALEVGSHSGDVPLPGRSLRRPPSHEVVGDHRCDGLPFEGACAHLVTDPSVCGKKNGGRCRDVCAGERDRLRPISTLASFFFRVRPIRLRPISTSANFRMLNFVTTKRSRPEGVEAPEGWRPKPGQSGPRRVGPEGWPSAFFPLPPQFSFFLLSLGGPFVEFWWCLKRRCPEMCTFGVLGSCEAPAGCLTFNKPSCGHHHRNTDCFVFGTQACFVLSPFSGICDESGF